MLTPSLSPAFCSSSPLQFRLPWPSPLLSSSLPFFLETSRKLADSPPTAFSVSLEAIVPSTRLASECRFNLGLGSLLNLQEEVRAFIFLFRFRNTATDVILLLSSDRSKLKSTQLFDVKEKMRSKGIASRRRPSFRIFRRRRCVSFPGISPDPSQPSLSSLVITLFSLWEGAEQNTNP